MIDIDPRWAWQPYKPSTQSPWDVRKVGHLYRRAAFGANWKELQEGVKAGPDACIAKLLSGGSGLAEFETQTEPLAQSVARTNNDGLLAPWWLYRMLYSPHPLREKITLFWHNHFATSNRKVNNATYMLGQYRLLYRHAQGSFRTMLQEISTDPAMLVWLDTNLSKRKMPNENYARELMELFSLGIGHYTEQDIREAAKAFTGWELTGGKAVFNAKEHDVGIKTVLGKKGDWKGADIVGICLEQPSAPTFVVTKLFRFLVSDTIAPTSELIEPLAAQFRKSDYQSGSLIETILRSNLFFSPMAYRTQVKSPVDFALGIVRALEGRIGTTALAGSLEELGQSLFHPPSVKGWDGGSAWLNGQTLLFRQNLALALTSTEDNRFGRRTDPAQVALAHQKRTPEEQVDFFMRLFLQEENDNRSKLLAFCEKAEKQSVPSFWTARDASEHRVRTLCHLILTLPEFQLN